MGNLALVDKFGELHDNTILRQNLVFFVLFTLKILDNTILIHLFGLNVLYV